MGKRKGRQLKKISNILRTGHLVLLLSLIICGVGLAAEVEKGTTDQTEINMVYGPETNGPEHFWPDSSLKEIFLIYWKARLSRDWQEARKIEAPYFQEMTRPGRYRVYMTGPKKDELIEMQLLQFSWEEKNLCKIGMELKFRLANGRMEKVYLDEWWVKAGGEWYHVVRDDFFFPEV